MPPPLIQSNIFQVVPSCRPFLGKSLDTTSAPSSNCSRVKASERLLPLRCDGCKTFNATSERNKIFVKRHNKYLKPTESLNHDTRFLKYANHVRVCQTIFIWCQYKTRFSHFQRMSQPHPNLSVLNNFIPFYRFLTVCYGCIGNSLFFKPIKETKR